MPDPVPARPFVPSRPHNSAGAAARDMAEQLLAALSAYVQVDTPTHGATASSASAHRPAAKSAHLPQIATALRRNALRLDDLARALRMIECYVSTARVVEVSCGDTAFSDQVKVLVSGCRASFATLRTHQDSMAQNVAQMRMSEDAPDLAFAIAQARDNVAAILDLFLDIDGALPRDLARQQAECAKLIALATRLSGSLCCDGAALLADVAGSQGVIAKLMEAEIAMRLATMNVFLRAFRLGDDGAAMKVIAQQFKDLAQDCGTLQREIGAELAKIQAMAETLEAGTLRDDQAKLCDSKATLRAALDIVLDAGPGVQAALARPTGAGG